MILIFLHWVGKGLKIFNRQRILSCVDLSVLLVYWPRDDPDCLVIFNVLSFNLNIKFEDESETDINL